MAHWRTHFWKKKVSQSLTVVQWPDQILLIPKNIPDAQHTETKTNRKKNLLAPFRKLRCWTWAHRSLSFSFSLFFFLSLSLWPLSSPLSRSLPRPSRLLSRRSLCPYTLCLRIDVATWRCSNDSGRSNDSVAAGCRSRTESARTDGQTDVHRPPSFEVS